MSETYISVETAVSLAMQYCQDDDGVRSKAGHDLRELLDDLENTAPADVRPVKEGYWIIHKSDLFPADSTIECDQCHAEQPIWIDDNFCPNCGAKMRPDGGTDR